MTEPDSLMGRVLRARYFPHGYFLEATLGTGPFATWRSIMKARPFLEQGIRTRIGNGYSTAIWGSAWIPEHGNFKVITPPPVTWFPQRVADLINPLTWAWDREFINNTFWEVDRARILAIPLGTISAEDRMVWHYSKNRRFSVRTCYKFIIQNFTSSPEQTEGSTSGVASFGWNKIWGLPIPPKIRMFLWRACVGILPHKLELFRRHIASNPFCESCHSGVESISDVLMQCRGMSEIWSRTPFNLPVLDPQAPMCSIFQWLKEKLLPDLFHIGLVVCWKVWKMRNLEFLGEDRPPDVVAWATAFLDSYKQAQLRNSISTTPALPNTWTPHNRSNIKVNVDVGLTPNSDSFVVSMVARDCDGRCIWWRRKEILGRPSPSDGEAAAVLFGNQVAMQRSWRRVIIETDCLPVHCYLLQRRSSFESYGAILDSCLELSPYFQYLSFSFVKRSGSTISHALATASHISCNEGCSLPFSLIY